MECKKYLFFLKKKTFFFFLVDCSFAAFLQVIELMQCLVQGLVQFYIFLRRSCEFICKERAAAELKEAAQKARFQNTSAFLERLTEKRQQEGGGGRKKENKVEEEAKKALFLHLGQMREKRRN